LALGTRIASRNEADYPIHGTIKQGIGLIQLLETKDKSTQASLQVFADDCDAQGVTPIALALELGFMEEAEKLAVKYGVRCDGELRNKQKEKKAKVLLR
jgi:hypothetical protein